MLIIKIKKSKKYYFNLFLNKKYFLKNILYDTIQNIIYLIL